MASYKHIIDILDLHYLTVSDQRFFLHISVYKFNVMTSPTIFNLVLHTRTDPSDSFNICYMCLTGPLLLKNTISKSVYPESIFWQIAVCQQVVNTNL